jgi:uncharacterized membrane protein
MKAMTGGRMPPTQRNAGRRFGAPKAGLALLILGIATDASACPSCAAEFRQALASFGWARPSAGLALVGAACVAAVLLGGRALASSEADRARLRAGMLLGVGLGGFIDGIVLHQILQWHGMLSGVLAPVDLVSSKVGMFWDGIFHAAMWAFAACGLWRLWVAAAHRPLRGQGSRFVAALFLGWAVFNVAEGIIDHQLLGLHHVRDFVAWRAPWDWSFLGLSAVMGVVSASWIARHRLDEHDSSLAAVHTEQAP